MTHRSRFPRSLILLAALCAMTGFASAADQSWLRVSSDHFIVLTDAGDKKGHEVAARFEQMRAVFGQLLMRQRLRLAEPIEIIALRSDKDYAQIAPLVNGDPTQAPAFFLVELTEQRSLEKSSTRSTSPLCRLPPT